MGDSMSTETVWRDGQIFTESAIEPVFADILRIESGATISFANSIVYNIRCNKLFVDGPCTFDVRGKNGTNSVTPNHRMPDKREQNDGRSHQDIHSEFISVWPHDLDNIGVNASSPTPGSNGARVTIHFGHFEGHQLDPVAQTLKSGGRGGKGARGGEGRTLWCICGAECEADPGPGSSDAPDGKDGWVKLEPFDPWIEIKPSLYRSKK
jgi:hypothetical protein